MKKQGFTLIELMVVIVIMGILAAVAVPKLFGMIAKSKASEVPTAAGTWINLQDAYVTEKNEVGDWNSVGYTGPGNRVNTSKYTTTNFEYYEESAGDWKAKNVVVLNECKANSVAWGWTATANTNNQGQGGMTLQQLSDTGDLKYCTGLTPSFSTLGQNYKAQTTGSGNGGNG